MEKQMSKTYRNRLTIHKDWFGKIPRIWIEKKKKKIQISKDIRAYIAQGPGGADCLCCFPNRGSKERKYLFKTAKRKANAFWRTEWLNS